MEKEYELNKDNFESELNWFLKRKLGFGANGKMSKVGKGRFNLVINYVFPKIIDDSKSKSRLVKFINFKSVAVGEVIETDKNINKVILPDIDNLSDSISNKLNNLVFDAEEYGLPK